MEERNDYSALYDDKRVRRQPLPGILGEIEQICDYLTAEKFALTFGGEELYIPIIITPAHPVAAAVGNKAAVAIAQRLGGGGERGGTTGGSAWAVPLGDAVIKWNVVRRLRLQGLSRNEIVRVMRDHFRLPLTTNHVSRLTADIGAKPLPRRGKTPLANQNVVGTL